jgi:hypothetical protein
MKLVIAEMSVLTLTRISVQERKGRSESRVLHSADITQFYFRMSSSVYHINVTVNCRDVCINLDIYFSAREEGRK